MKAMEVKKMNNYYWNKRNVSLDKDEIAPWKLPRDKHATISILLHRENELQTVDDYLSTCEELYDVDYKKRLNGSTTEAWNETLNRLHARYNKRKNNKVLECLQFGGNKEFWDGFQSKNEIFTYFEKCYEYAVQKIGYMQTDKNIICAVKIFQPNRRNLFVYYLPVTEIWQEKVMSDEKNEYGTRLQKTDEHGEPVYRLRINRETPILSHSAFWKRRGGLTAYSELQEDFYNRISSFYGAVRGKSTSLIKNTAQEQISRYNREQGDAYDEKYFDDSPY